MKIDEIQKNLPPGFGLVREKRKTIIFRDGWGKIVKRLGKMSREELRREYPEVERLRGRGRPLVIPTAREKVVIRHYYHGGGLRWLTGDRFVSFSRPRRELCLLEKLFREGFNVTRPVGLVADRDPWGFFRADLYTVFVPGGLDLLNYYRDWNLRPSPEQLREKRQIITSAAAQIRRLHQFGVFHPDLQLKNILIRNASAGRQIILLDFDKAWRMDSLSPDLVLKNLLRFYRSFRKIQMTNRAISKLDPVRFLFAYAPKDKKFRRYVMRKIAQRKLMHYLHLLKWKIAIKLFKASYARSFRH